MADIYLTSTGRRDRDRLRRATRLRKAYRGDGDNRKLKRAQRLEAQARLSAARRLNRQLSGVGAHMEQASAAMARAVRRISDAFAKLRTSTDPALIAAAQVKGREVADRIASQLEGAQRP